MHSLPGQGTGKRQSLKMTFSLHIPFSGRSKTKELFHFLVDFLFVWCGGFAPPLFFFFFVFDVGNEITER